MFHHFSMRFVIYVRKNKIYFIVCFIVLLLVNCLLYMNANRVIIEVSKFRSKYIDTHDPFDQCSNQEPFTIPPIILLNGRKDSWTKNSWGNFNITIFHPEAFYVNKEVLPLWETRLSLVYIHALNYAFEHFESDNFIFLEDDVDILDESLLMCYIRNVVTSDEDFYSFYNCNRKDIVYEWGTQMFYVKRSYIKEIIRLSLSRPNIPFDIVISEGGNRKKASRSVIHHNGSRMMI
jgi:hypothetical protein